MDESTPINFGKLRDRSWDIKRSARALKMPDGRQRIVRMPEWAWNEWDLFDAAFQVRVVRNNWCQEFIHQFNELITAEMHYWGRRRQYLAYWAKYRDSVPGKMWVTRDKQVANDHFNPHQLPYFPHPHWRFASNRWLEENELLELPYLLHRREVPKEAKNGLNELRVRLDGVYYEFK